MCVGVSRGGTSWLGFVVPETVGNGAEFQHCLDRQRDGLVK